jgi:hypothetical protein
MAVMKMGLLSLLLGLSSLTTATAAIFQISLDTSDFSGADAALVFDWVANDGLVNNTVTVSAFGTDGTFDPTDAAFIGDVTGSLTASVHLGDTEAFNEFSQPLLLGYGLTFRLALDNAFSGAGLPDELTFLLLDAWGLPLYSTANPTGADTLLAIDAVGGTDPGVQIYPPAAGIGAAAQVVRLDTVPEPCMALLWLVGAPLAWRYRAMRA